MFKHLRIKIYHAFYFLCLIDFRHRNMKRTYSARLILGTYPPTSAYSNGKENASRKGSVMADDAL